MLKVKNVEVIRARGRSVSRCEMISETCKEGMKKARGSRECSRVKVRCHSFARVRGVSRRATICEMHAESTGNFLKMMIYCLRT